MYQQQKKDWRTCETATEWENNLLTKDVKEAEVFSAVISTQSPAVGKLSVVLPRVLVIPGSDFQAQPLWDSVPKI